MDIVMLGIDLGKSVCSLVGLRQRRGRLRVRTIDRSCMRSSALIDNALFGRPARIGYLLS